MTSRDDLEKLLDSLSLTPYDTKKKQLAILTIFDELTAQNVVLSNMLLACTTGMIKLIDKTGEMAELWTETQAAIDRAKEGR